MRRKIGDGKKVQGGTTVKKDVKNSHMEIFWDWGIPTVDALKSVCLLKSESPSLKIIASGGISNGIECAKSIAFGADFSGSALPVLQTLVSGGTKAVLRLIDQWEWELKSVMFLTGSRTIPDLQKQILYTRV